MQFQVCRFSYEANACSSFILFYVYFVVKCLVVINISLVHNFHYSIIYLDLRVYLGALSGVIENLNVELLTIASIS